MSSFNKDIATKLLHGLTKMLGCHPVHTPTASPAPKVSCF